jgi:hypothetical protein
MNGQGSLRVVHDVTIWLGDENEFVATSEVPAIAGELLVLERHVNGETCGVAVYVLESRPIFVDGRLRHRLLLRADRQIDGLTLDSNSRAH